MSIVKQWAFALCSAVVITAILRLLMPKGAMRWIYNLVLSVFLLVVLIAPFMATMPNFAIELYIEPANNIEEMTNRLVEAVDTQTEDIIKNKAEKIVSSILEKAGIKTQEAAIHIIVKGQNQATGEPEISAEIYLPQEYFENIAGIRQELERELGFAVNIISYAKGGS